MADAKDGLIEGGDGRTRCSWPGGDDLYCRYHDNEWGFPVGDDRRLFEKICLEGFQSGLSWLTILRKRENFREAFDNFEFERVARYTEKDVERLLGARLHRDTTLRVRLGDDGAGLAEHGTGLGDHRARRTAHDAPRLLAELHDPRR